MITKEFPKIKKWLNDYRKRTGKYPELSKKTINYLGQKFELLMLKITDNLVITSTHKSEIVKQIKILDRQERYLKKINLHKMEI
ncbi:MAG: hypothetical protein K0U20_07890 [Proteobacteria bacterium]|nr:hypothetical protein [Pseudomonadota bacterium]